MWLQGIHHRISRLHEIANFFSSPETSLMSDVAPSQPAPDGFPLDDDTAEFPVVGVGASAGGLEAFSELLSNLPSSPGLAFVLIQHLDPNHPSLLSEILARGTSLKVVQATEGMPVEPDHVYVIPPNCALTISDYSLHLSDRQIGHMSRLLDDLLDIARINRGKIELRKELLIIQDVIRRAIESSQFLIDSRGHHLDVSLPDEPIYLAADPSRLEQVFCNLLNNAAKYTDSGGRIQIVTAPDDGFVSVKVSDTGVGIEPELLHRVFDLFTQADRSIDRSQGGLGIGLSLVKNLVNLHSGTVDAFSEGAGKGCTFVVRLPRVESETRDDSTAARSGDQNGEKKNSKNVLVVDDNRDAALTLSMLLNAAGHEVDVAYSGRDALAMAADRRPDIVLLDIGLPQMDGYEVARRLRQDLKLTDIMIVAVTGYGQEEDRRRSAEAGFDLHYIKPINPRDLDELIKKVP
jgi:chemotaxis response regulator CheB